MNFQKNACAGLLLGLLLGFKCTSVYAQELKQIKGKVYDADSREVLVGVSIYSPGGERGATTNHTGRFEFLFPDLTDSLIVSYLGYESAKIGIGKTKVGEELSVGLQPLPQSLQTIVVTAGRDRQERSESPLAISSLSAQQLNEAKPTVLAEALNKVPGVLMVNLGGEQHSMSIRQPMSYKGYYLYLEDGIPLRPAGLFNHNALIEVNMFGLRSIEVIRGPASSLYGSEAIGGVVNFIGLSPSIVPTAGVGIHADSWGYKRTQWNAGGYIGKKLGIVGGGYFAKQHNGWQGHSDFDKVSINLRADYFVSKNTKIVGSISKNKLNTQMGGSLDSVGFYKRTYNTLHTFTYRKVDALRAKIALQHFWNESAESSLTLFYRNNSIGQLPSYSVRNIKSDLLKAYGEENINSFKSYGLSLQQNQYLKWAADAKIIAGIYVDYTPSYYNAHFVAIDREAGTGRYILHSAKPDSLLTSYRADLLNTATYLQAEVNPLTRLKLVAGIRYDRIDYNFDNYLPPSAFSGAPDEKNHFAFFTPKLGATYEVCKSTALYSNISKGAYAPGINELFRGVKVPALSPARFINYEAGFWTGMADNKLHLEAAVYFMTGKNEIVAYRLEDGSTENRNSGETLHSGVEYSLSYSPNKQWMIRFGGTNARHQFLNYAPNEGRNFNGNNMPNAPAWIANGEITYKPAKIPGLRTGLEWQRISRWFIDEGNTQQYDDKTFMGLKGVSILNFRTAYNWKGAEIYLNVINLTDELYAHNVTANQWGNVYNPAAARTFSFGLAYQFKGKIRD